MLNPDNQKIIENCLSKISEHLPNYKVRSGQIQMINAVAETLSRSLPLSFDPAEPLPQRQGESILVVEGPTGIGKSLGYLLPAVIIAKATEKKLVVSSATIALQEQLANKDIPFLANYSELKLTYVIAKGRSRYICPSRLYQYRTSIEQHDLFNTDTTSATERLQHIQFLKNQLEQNNWSGDRDNLSQPIPDTLWLQITNDRHGCTNRRCDFFASCPFYKARAALENADIIIANHDLLLADIAMGAGTILPHPSESFYCIDEAHHFSDKGIQQLAAAHGILGTLAWLEKIQPVVARVMLILKIHSAAQTIQDLVEVITENLHQLHTVLESFEILKVNSAYRCPHGQLPESLHGLRDNLMQRSQLLLDAMELLKDALRRKKLQPQEDDKNPAVDKVLSELSFLCGRVENMTTVWNLFGEKTADGDAPIAKWFTAQLMKNHQVEYGIFAARVRIGPLLAKRFWQLAAGAILTSATLRSLGNFNLLMTETGLNELPQTNYLALASPFDLSQQGCLSIPSMKTDPKNSQGHTRELIELLPTLININNPEGTLVLFSSRKQMLEVAHALPVQLKILLLIQGTQSKEKLINEHFARIQAKQSSVLFGLASFAEGLDLPGKACTHVIIAKLPFAVPDEPIVQTLAEWIDSNGGNAFKEITLPTTSIKLIQAMGRLIRTESDVGMVTILDTRLKTKPYGRLLLKTLPPFKMAQ